jgi:hypothetical protein
MKPVYPVSKMFIDIPASGGEHRAAAVVGYDMAIASNSWATAARRALVSGSIASLLSTATLAACGRIENRNAAGPINGPSQWLWGRRAARARRPSLRHTLVGHAVHHVCACGWALVHERFLQGKPNDPASARMAKAAATAALAAFVDYRVTPKRFQPGFDVHLAKPSLFAAYAAFALGLALAPRKR